MLIILVTVPLLYIKRKIVFKQFKGKFCKIKTIKPYHLRGSDSFLPPGNKDEFWNYCSYHFAFNRYIHTLWNRHFSIHSLKSVSLNKSVVYYTTHSSGLSNQLDIVDIFSLSFVLLVCNGKEVDRYITEVYNCLRIFSFLVNLCSSYIISPHIIIVSRKILFRLTFTEDGVSSRWEFLKIESVQLETVQNNCCRQN